MIIYKVIIDIDKKIKKDWLTWMEKEHIPEIMALNIFNKSKIYNIINPEKKKFASYCIEYYCSSMEKYNEYKTKFSKKLQEKHTQKYKDKFTGKRLILSLQNEF